MPAPYRPHRPTRAATPGSLQSRSADLGSDLGTNLVSRMAYLQGTAGNRAVSRLIGKMQAVQRLELTAGQWQHIAKGEVRVPPKLVGYHWTGDGEAVARKNGQDQKGPDRLGIYVEGVESIAQYPTGKGGRKAPLTKGTPSTFWPDAWSADEIKDAIAKAGTPRNNLSTVAMTATRQEARGMLIFSNAESRFPMMEEPEEEPARGRGRGKKKGK